MASVGNQRLLKREPEKRRASKPSSGSLLPGLIVASTGSAHSKESVPDTANLCSSSLGSIANGTCQKTGEKSIPKMKFDALRQGGAWCPTNAATTPLSNINANRIEHLKLFQARA